MIKLRFYSSLSHQIILYHSDVKPHASSKIRKERKRFLFRPEGLGMGL